MDRSIKFSKCSFCLEKVATRYIGKCPKCNLKNICGNCLIVHLEKHGQTKEQKLLDDLLQINDIQKLDLGNSVGMF